MHHHIAFTDLGLNLNTVTEQLLKVQACCTLFLAFCFYGGAVVRNTVEEQKMGEVDTGHSVVFSW